MVYKYWLSPHFVKQVKHYAKKYRHIKEDINQLLENFDKRKHQFLGNNTYKIRLKSTDIPRGKSKSFRLIMYISEEHKVILPIAFYFKGEREIINQEEINYHLAMVLKDFQAMRELKPRIN